jgi:hypothetical protein
MDMKTPADQGNLSAILVAQLEFFKSGFMLLPQINGQEIAISISTIAAIEAVDETETQIWLSHAGRVIRCPLLATEIFEILGIYNHIVGE